MRLHRAKGGMGVLATVDAKPAMNSGRRRRQAQRPLLLGGAAVLFILAIAAGSAESAEEESKQTPAAKAQAGKLSAFFGEIAAQLQLLSEEPSLIALFEQDDEGLLAQEAEKSVQQFAHGLKLRLLRPGQYELDNEGYPPLSYASLDLLRRAESAAGPSSLEALFFGDPAQHLVLAQSVSNKDGALIGLLHLSLDVALLEEAAAGLALSEGYVELQQSARGTPLVLASSGVPAAKAGEPVVVDVEGTRWRVAYWQAASAPMENGTAVGLPLLLILSALLAVLVVGGGMAFFLKRRSAGDEDDEDVEREDEDTEQKDDAELEEDAEPGIVYAGAVKAIMDGAHPGLERLVPNLPNRGQRRIVPTSKPADRTGDDITRIVRKDEVQAAVQKEPGPAKKG